MHGNTTVNVARKVTVLIRFLCYVFIGLGFLTLLLTALCLHGSQSIFIGALLEILLTGMTLGIWWPTYKKSIVCYKAILDFHDFLI